MSGGARGRVLYAGQSYYNTWYLSRALRARGWQADVLNWDANPADAGFYHGEDYRLTYGSRFDAPKHLAFFLLAAPHYDVFHFSNPNGIRFGTVLHDAVARRLWPGAEIELLRRLGKKIVYTNTGCLDGVSQSSFAAWGDRPVCEDCQWRDRPDVCSDERNLAWGEFRNSVTDFQVLLGGNRTDFNVGPSIHEVPEFYCLDPEFWRPGLPIPDRFRLPIGSETVKIYHAVGNAALRSRGEAMRNIKSTHIYMPLIEELKRDGYDVALTFFHDVPNRDVRYYQAQSDIVVEMLTYGWFGAGAREAMMLGKPVVCYLRPEWLRQMRTEIPDYVDELPVVSATPETVREVLIDLIENPSKRQEIGRRSREFALKWHSGEAGARRFDAIYSDLIAGTGAELSHRDPGSTSHASVGMTS